MLIPKTGEKIGDFEIIRRIGAGGMGAVYQARQLSTDRHVALKIFSPAMTREKTRNRFMREAQSAARLDHPHIVAVYHIHSDEDLCYYAMELIDGWPLGRIMHWLPGLKAEPRKSLVDLLKQRGEELCPVDPDAETIIEAPGQSKSLGKTPGQKTSAVPQIREAVPLIQNRHYLREVAGMIRDIARALDYAHDQGVIHRDIKPDNLLLEHTGRLCLTDFGLARLIDEESITLTGELMGTPLYMSPEQVAAGRIGMDHRTDIYSLGVVLYQMLCLRPPYEAASREALLRAITLQPPIPLARQNPAIPRSLETIVHHTLAKDPIQRYATAGKLADDLDRWLAGKPIHAPRPGRISQWWRRRSSAAKKTLIASAAGLVIALTAVTWYMVKTAGPQPTSPPVTAKLTSIEQARQWAEQHDYLKAALWHAQALTEDYLPTELDNLHRSVVFHQLPRLTTRLEIKASRVTFDLHPHKPLLAINNKPGELEIHNLDTNQTNKITFSGAQEPKWAGYNRSGNALATITTDPQGDYLHMYDPNGQALTKTPAGPLPELREIRLANDVPIAAVLCQISKPTLPTTQPASKEKNQPNYRAMVFDFSTDQPQKPRTFTTRKAVELSADGKFLAVISNKGVLQVFNLHNGGVMSFPFLGEPAGFIFSPQTMRPILAVTDRIGQITLYDVSQGQQMPNGTRMPEQLLILRTEPGRQRVAPVYMHFNADATRLLVVGAETLGEQVSGRSIRLWNTADGQKVFEARGQDACFSREGQTLVFYDKNQVTFVDVPDNKVINQISNPVRESFPLFQSLIRSVPPGLNHSPISVDTHARRAVIMEPVKQTNISAQQYLASVWDTATGEKIYRLLTPRAELLKVALSPQGKYACACYQDKDDQIYMYAWDLRESDALMPRAAALPYLPRTQNDIRATAKPFVTVYMQHNDGYAWAMINPVSLSLLQPLVESDDPAEAWRVSSDGSTLVEIGFDDRLRAINFETGNVLQNWQLPATATRVLALSANGQRAAVTHADFRIALHDIKAPNGDNVYDEIGLLTGQPTTMCFNRKGTRIAIADALGRVVVNETRPPFNYICEADTGRAVSELAFCEPNQSCIAIGHTDGSVHLWSLSKGRQIAFIESLTEGNGPTPAHLALLNKKDETTPAILAVSTGRQILLFSLSTSSNNTLQPAGPPLETSQPITAVSFSVAPGTENELVHPLYAVTRKGAVRWFRLDNLQLDVEQWRDHIIAYTGMRINEAGQPVFLPQDQWQTARRQTTLEE